MPQIPVYNKGQGTTVDLATGSLSPQASVQAFTAPGRATENFANNAQQIAFNFGQAEKLLDTMLSFQGDHLSYLK